MHRTLHLILAGLVVATTACIHRRGATEGAATPQPPDSVLEALAAANPVTVEVTNNYEIPMEVHAYGVGTSYRMGVVAQGMHGQFVLRTAMVLGGFVELVAQPTGYGPQIRSGRLQIVPGDVIDFTISTLLRGSIATIRP